jgi:glycosyltransferase involved in cell wall biosynthesis
LAVAARYPDVCRIRQGNQGLSAARNTGLRHSSSNYLIFLDADDRLLPEAVEVALRQLQAHPECAFVSGQFQYITADGSYLSTPAPTPLEHTTYLTLLQGNHIVMHAAVLYRRRVLDAVGVFDSSVDAAEDYDLYLRIAREYPVCSHDQVVAEYRRHSGNMTSNLALMTRQTMKVRRRQWRFVKDDAERTAAYWEGHRHWRQNYGRPLVDQVRAHIGRREWGLVLRGLVALLHYHPRGIRSVLGNAHPVSSISIADESRRS